MVIPKLAIIPTAHTTIWALMPAPTKRVFTQISTLNGVTDLLPCTISLCVELNGIKRIVVEDAIISMFAIS